MRYIEWPQDKSIGDFVIGIKDAHEVYQEVLLISKIKKTIGNHTIIVKEVTDSDPNLNVLFVGKSFSGNISTLCNSAKNNHTLLITDVEHAIKKGAGIELIIIDNKAEFDISKHNIKDCKLNVYRELLDLARNLE